MLNGFSEFLGKERTSFILFHITSLPDPPEKTYGIGELGSEAFRFIDFLKDTGISIWQILPFGHTGYQSSPYQTFSRFAGSPYLISIESLFKSADINIDQHENYINQVSSACPNQDKADYGWLFHNKIGMNSTEKTAILRIAFNSFKNRSSNDDRIASFLDFCRNNSFWLDDYSDFMALKEYHDHKPWHQWEKEFKHIVIWKEKRSSILKKNNTLDETIHFYKYLQFCFFQQWQALKKYASENGRYFIGDIPWYVGMDSADVWSKPELFELNKQGEPVNVAGVPPDYFSATGQLWGNPLYCWKNPDTIKWWVDALYLQFSMVDFLRIDHFRAIDAYWKIPYSWAKTEQTATNGYWDKGPGEALLNAIKKRLSTAKGLPIIAEDLGYLEPLYSKPELYPESISEKSRYIISEKFSKLINNCDKTLTGGLNPETGEYNTRKAVDYLLEKFSLPGMRVLQFGFEGDDENESETSISNSVVYTGTHDNNTTLGWFKECKSVEENEQTDVSLEQRIRETLFSDHHFVLKNLKDDQPLPESEISWCMIEIALRSSAVLAGAPLQDFLGLDESARMNQPGDISGSWWTWRCTYELLHSPELIQRIRQINQYHDR